MHNTKIIKLTSLADKSANLAKSDYTKCQRLFAEFQSAVNFANQQINSRPLENQYVDYGMFLADVDVRNKEKHLMLAQNKFVQNFSTTLTYFYESLKAGSDIDSHIRFKLSNLASFLTKESISVVNRTSISIVLAQIESFLINSDDNRYQLFRLVLTRLKVAIQ